MVLTDLIANLETQFPKHADEIRAWIPSYTRLLGKLGPTELAQTYGRTIDAWRKSYPPRPADFQDHRPERSRSSEDNLAASARLTQAAQAEQKALAQRTLALYADQIARHRNHHPALAHAFDLHIEHEIKKAAWVHAVETARGRPPLKAIELSAEMLQSAHDRVESQARMPSGNLGQLLKRSDARERQRERLQELADQYHAPLDRAESA